MWTNISKSIPPDIDDWKIGKIKETEKQIDQEGL